MIIRDSYGKIYLQGSIPWDSAARVRECAGLFDEEWLPTDADALEAVRDWIELKRMLDMDELAEERDKTEAIEARGDGVVTTEEKRGEVVCGLLDSSSLTLTLGERKNRIVGFRSGRRYKSFNEMLELARLCDAKGRSTNGDVASNDVAFAAARDLLDMRRVLGGNGSLQGYLFRDALMMIQSRATPDERAGELAALRYEVRELLDKARVDGKLQLVGGSVLPRIIGADGSVKIPTSNIRWSCLKEMREFAENFDENGGPNDLLALDAARDWIELKRMLVDGELAENDRQVVMGSLKVKISTLEEKRGRIVVRLFDRAMAEVERRRNVALVELTRSDGTRIAGPKSGRTWSSVEAVRRYARCCDAKWHSTDPEVTGDVAFDAARDWLEIRRMLDRKELVGPDLDAVEESLSALDVTPKERTSELAVLRHEVGEIIGKAWVGAKSPLSLYIAPLPRGVNGVRSPKSGTLWDNIQDLRNHAGLFDEKGLPTDTVALVAASDWIDVQRRLDDGTLVPSDEFEVASVLYAKPITLEEKAGAETVRKYDEATKGRSGGGELARTGGRIIGPKSGLEWSNMMEVRDLAECFTRSEGMIRPMNGARAVVAAMDWFEIRDRFERSALSEQDMNEVRSLLRTGETYEDRISKLAAIRADVKIVLGITDINGLIGLIPQQRQQNLLRREPTGGVYGPKSGILWDDIRGMCERAGHFDEKGLPTDLLALQAMRDWIELLSRVHDDNLAASDAAEVVRAWNAVGCRAPDGVQIGAETTRRYYEMIEARLLVVPISVRGDEITGPISREKWLNIAEVRDFAGRFNDPWNPTDDRAPYAAADWLEMRRRIRGGKLKTHDSGTAGGSEIELDLREPTEGERIGELAVIRAEFEVLLGLEVTDERFLPVQTPAAPEQLPDDSDYSDDPYGVASPRKPAPQLTGNDGDDAENSDPHIDF
jgi:hypothetical protein